MPESSFRGEQGESKLIQSRHGLTGKVSRFALPWPFQRAADEDDETPDWPTRLHPDYEEYSEAEERQRASYVATRRALAPFLVPHRFEGDKPSEALRRTQFGFGIGLNEMWVTELMGHVRGTEATYNFGPMASEADQQTAGEGQAGPPTGGVASRMWDDITLQNVKWPNFFNGKVLERILTSVGGVIVVDSQQANGEARRRPVFRWFPASSVEDYGWGKTGFRWIKLSESVDKRRPRSEEEEGFEHRHLLYELDDNDSTIVTRVNDEGDELEAPRDLGRFVDREGHPTPPLVLAKYGEHPDIDVWGSGLLMGPDDIVIDLWNLVSEMRAGYRDAAFSLWKYWGDNETAVRKQFEQGSRLIRLGDKDMADLQRDSGSSAEVTSALEIIDIALKAWALSAKRKQAEAMESARAVSGVQLKAEFQLDDRPLLTVITETLDDIESQAMFLAGQMADERANEKTLADVGVERSTEFQLEAETSRISRIVKEFSQAFSRQLLGQRVTKRFVMRWLEASDVIDLSEEIEGERTLGELVEEEVAQALEEDAQARRVAAEGAIPFDLR